MSDAKKPLKAGNNVHRDGAARGLTIRTNDYRAINRIEDRVRKGRPTKPLPARWPEIVLRVCSKPWRNADLAAALDVSIRTTQMWLTDPDTEHYDVLRDAIAQAEAIFLSKLTSTIYEDAIGAKKESRGNVESAKYLLERWEADRYRVNRQGDQPSRIVIQLPAPATDAEYASRSATIDVQALPAPEEG